MHCVPKISNLWQLQKNFRRNCRSCIYCEKAGGIWGAIDQSNENLSEKQKLIQKQSRVIVEKDRESKENMAAVKGTEGGNNREQEYDLDQQNRALDAAACDNFKKYLKSCKKWNRISQLQA